MDLIIHISEEDFKHLAYANHFKLRSYIESGEVVEENALEQEPCADAISRRAVLDMLEDINAETEGVGFYYDHYVEYIKNLPPVTPQYTEAEIQKMQDLEFAEIQKAYEIGKDDGSVGADVLDKIKAEIEQTRKIYLDMNDIDWLNGCDYVLSVIDKYKAESEGKTNADYN